MVDIHTHILPAIDDGSKSWEMTMEMCRLAKADGTTHIVATPHANYEYDYNRESHLALLDELRSRCNGEMEFSLGCDFHMSYDNVQDALANPGRYAIGSGPYMLVEFSDYSIPQSINDALHELVVAGLIPVITHPERNPILQKHPERVIQWIETGCIVQVTANSLTGFWGSTPKKISKWLLENEAVHIIASDAHDPRRRTPVLSGGKKAAASLVGEEIAQMLVSDNPQAVVTGARLPYQP